MVLLPQLALAHPGHGLHGVADGFLHPFTGWDHCIAMLAVGLWAAMGEKRSQWLVLGGFMVGMLGGGWLGMHFSEPQHIETAVQASALVAALLVVLAVRMPVAIQLTITAMFAVFHGIAHGAELPQQVGAMTYGLGFMLATSLLLSLGWLIGRQLVTEARQRGFGLVLAVVAGGMMAA